MDTEAIKVRIPQLIARKLKITEKQLWKIVELEGMKTEEVDVAELPTRLMKGFRGRKASLINDESYSNFLDKGIILKKDIAEEVFENLLISPDIVFDEIRRFDERYTNGHGLVEMESAVIYKKTNKKGREKFFSKKQVELWKKELGDNLISKVKWGSLLLTEPKNNEGICIDEVIEEFGLENNKKNRKRIVGYHEKGHLYFEDKGTITETLEENKRIFSIEERKTIRPFMEKIYKSFYSADPEYEDMNLVKHRKDLTFLTGRIDLRTNKKEINRFKQKTISQEAFAEYLFGDCMNFFIDKLNENNLAEILE
ncbi:MAG: hypothetical protein KKA79_07575, partial [Nanoarchaeota archaeon]|nr:hypothetical protein [Nanoarchaeota archaeon]